MNFILRYFLITVMFLLFYVNILCGIFFPKAKCIQKTHIASFIFVVTIVKN